MTPRAGRNQPCPSLVRGVTAICHTQQATFNSLCSGGANTLLPQLLIRPFFTIKLQEPPSHVEESNAALILFAYLHEFLQESGSEAEYFSKI